MLFGVVQMRLDLPASLLLFTFSHEETGRSILIQTCFERRQNACLRCLLCSSSSSEKFKIPAECRVAWCAASPVGHLHPDLANLTPASGASTPMKRIKWTHQSKVAGYGPNIQPISGKFSIDKVVFLISKTTGDVPSNEGWPAQP